MQHRVDALVVFLAPVRPVVGIEPALPEISRPGVPLQEVGPLPVIGNVLGEVPAGLGDERAEVQHHVEANRVSLVDLRLGGALAQLRVEVFAVALQRGEPRVVVDAGAPPRQVVVRDIKKLRQQPRGGLHAVAQADHRQSG